MEEVTIFGGTWRCGPITNWPQKYLTYKPGTSGITEDLASVFSVVHRYRMLLMVLCSEIPRCASWSESEAIR